MTCFLCISLQYSAIKSQNTVKPNLLCRLPVTSATSRDVPFSPNSITPTSPKLPVQMSWRLKRWGIPRDCHSYYMTAMGNHVQAVKWCHFQWPWVTHGKLPIQGSFGEVGAMEFGLKGTSRLVADVTESRHSGLGFTVFWLFTAEPRYCKLRTFSTTVLTLSSEKLLSTFGTCVEHSWESDFNFPRNHFCRHVNELNI